MTQINPNNMNIATQVRATNTRIVSLATPALWSAATSSLPSRCPPYGLQPHLLCQVFVHPMVCSHIFSAKSLSTLWSAATSSLPSRCPPSGLQPHLLCQVVVHPLVCSHIFSAKSLSTLWSAATTSLPSRCPPSGLQPHLLCQVALVLAFVDTQ